MIEKISVYVVEDYFLVRASYRNTLAKQEDLELSGEFATAEECLDTLKANKENGLKQPNVILMDLGLPFMNGIEATRIIKSLYPDIKILILTCHEAQEEIIACLSTGANGYALKDSDHTSLMNVIRTVNSGAVWLDPHIAEITKYALPKPNSTDFDNLYDNGNIRSLLTQREFEALQLLIEGKSNVEIAKVMTVSVNTAKAHVGSILNKLAVTDRVQAAVKAVRSRLF